MNENVLMEVVSRRLEDWEDRYAEGGALLRATETSGRWQLEANG